MADFWIVGIAKAAEYLGMSHMPEYIGRSQTRAR